jgi:AcrR family transcriptional regulator
MPTANPTSPPRTYQIHRERQRRRILEAAERLFDEHGIDRVTMREIISATGLRTSTIYQYFSSKDDIVWAILEGVLADLAARAKIAIDREKTVLAKITALLELMADDLTRNQAKVRFLAQFDAMYARDGRAERLLTLEAQINPDGFQHFSRLIREGITDGSLRADLDPDLTLHAMINAVVGAQRRLASLGSRVELEYGQPIDSLFRETIRLILLGMRAT